MVRRGGGKAEGEVRLTFLQVLSQSEIRVILSDDLVLWVLLLLSPFS